jgi:hypothetical protein
MSSSLIQFRCKIKLIGRSLIFLCFLTTLITQESFSQSKLEIKNIFYEAESWILFEDYKEALPLYLQLLKINPSNSNYKYRIGQCYINTPGEKNKAVSFLEDAVKNINPDYKEGHFKETKAPYDALYYLANAYRINNQIDKALETYTQFKKNLDPLIYDSTIVNLQIISCRNAKELMKSPLFIRTRNLNNKVNESGSEFNPVVNDKEDMLVFSRSEAFYDAILYSKKINGEWSGPLNMNELLKVDKDLFPTSISNDGKTLYLYSSADYDGIIYTSRFENGSWSPVVKLNDNINTKYWESHATISHDDKKLYFTSNRKGTYGGLDIYVSERDSIGDWGPARNLGPVINTPYNEESPFLSSDDKTLFFSSRGHYNMGGYDIFYSTILPDGTMSVPLNAGYPLNSTDDDIFFKPVHEGYEGYFARESPEGFGKEDIYRIEIFSDQHPRKFLVRGLVKVTDLVSGNDSVRIMAMNVKNPGQTIVVYSEPSTGEYQFVLPQGKYEITYQGEGTEKFSRELDLPISNPSDSFVLPGTVLAKTDFTAEINIGNSRVITIASGDSILFPIKAEPKSYLTIERWHGDSLVSSENYFMTDSIFNYKMLPAEGENKIIFILKDRFNNTTTTDVYVTREKGGTEKTLIRPEYENVIANKQAEAFKSMLLNRSEGKIKELLERSELKQKHFGTVDDVISYLKKEVAGKAEKIEDLDRLALRVAVMDNVLTQDAVDYMAKYADGELKQILSSLNIKEKNIKTWTDLQEYVSRATQGRITAEQLNDLAAGILGDTDPSISLIRQRILAYAATVENGSAIKASVDATDSGKITKKDKWLETFILEGLNHGLSRNQITKLLVAISGNGDSAEQLLKGLISVAKEPFLSFLKSIDLRKEKIRTAEELLTYLMNNSDKSDKYSLPDLYDAIAGMSATGEKPDEFLANAGPSGNSFWWILLLILGAGLCSYYLLYKRRKISKE